MTLEDVIRNFEDDIDDIPYGITELLEKLKLADKPNHEQYVDLIDEIIEEEETKLTELQESIEPLRRYLLGKTERTNNDSLG